MPAVIPVKLPYVVRELWFDPGDTGAQAADHLICQTERGHEMGIACADACELTDDELTEVIGGAQLKPVVRVATEADFDRADEFKLRGEEALPVFRRLVAEEGLDMKPVGVEYLFDSEKAVCYFAAEERVDFRQLVRDLARELHVRIDMRQIGVREEAAIVGGWGHCGQELCCRRFNTAFDPVSIRMAKEQDLPLNSTKISGACGRLMCCLRYEFEAYRDFKSRAPKRNAVIDTPLGKGKIVEYDTPKEQLCLRLESGKQIRVALADMTASEVARAKSEELGCSCRPDTVSREVLDRLQSPDVQMALAELDRKMGVTNDSSVDESDLFVAPRQRRRVQRVEATGGEGRQGQGDASDKGGERISRRRRARRISDATTESAREVAPSDKSSEDTSGRSVQTRRRHHHQTQSTDQSQRQRGQNANARRQRGQGANNQRDQAPKHARRPGDHGGDAAQAQASQQGSANKTKRRRRRRGRGSDTGEGTTASADE